MRSMVSVPRRISRAAQVLEILRHGLRMHEWSERLPPEKVLSAQLQVSRSTLRAALEMLRREGKSHLVAIRHQ